jgi:sucrose phosphorylase
VRLLPQVCIWRKYFCWKNNYEAADNGGSAGHKEINRTTLTMQDIEQGLNRYL